MTQEQTAGDLEKIIYKGSTKFFSLLSIDYNLAKREVVIQVAPEGELKNNNRFKFINVENYKALNTDKDDDAEEEENNDFFPKHIIGIDFSVRKFSSNVVIVCEDMEYSFYTPDMPMQI